MENYFCRKANNLEKTDLCRPILRCQLSPPSPMGIRRILICVSLLLVLLSIISGSINCADDDRSFSSSSIRSILSFQNNSKIPNCSDMGSDSLCSRNPKCRWCRSETLDDMCFSKSGAWRLPSQVFSCI